MMDTWRTPIYCYVSPAGRDKIEDWYARLSTQERADTDEFLMVMRRIPATDWRMPHYRPKLAGIKGSDARKAKGLGELRWSSEKKEHRLLGFFWAGGWCAVIGCTHKQRVYSPRDALVTAALRKDEVQRGEAITTEYDL